MRPRGDHDDDGNGREPKKLRARSSDLRACLLFIYIHAAAGYFFSPRVTCVHV